MRRLAHAVVVTGLLLATREARGDEGWITNNRAHGFQLDGLHAPQTSSDPSTAALRLGDLSIGACGIFSVGTLSTFRCMTPADLFTVDATLKFTGTQLGLPTQPGVSLTGVAGSSTAQPGAIVASGGHQVPKTNAGGTAVSWGQLDYSELTGTPSGLPPSGAAGGDLAGSSYPNPVIAPGVVTFAKFQTVTGLSIPGVPGSSPASLSAITATANNQFLQMLGGSLQFHSLDYSQLTGTPAAVTSVTGAVTGAGPGATATTFGAAGAHSVLAVGGGSSAVPAFIGPGTAAEVFMADPSTAALGWEIPPLVTLSTPGYMSAGDKLKINGGVTPVATTDLLRYGDLQGCVGVLDWSGSALGCAPTLGFDPTLRLVSGLLGLATEPGFTLLGVGGSGTAQPGAITATTANTVPLYDGTSVAFRTVPGASVYADGIATGTIQLASLAAASLAAGTEAYVATVDDGFELRLSSLTADNITVVNASGKAGYQWMRLGLPSRKWYAVTSWYVDPGGGNDEGAGTIGAPLKTNAELGRRVAGRNLSSTIAINFVSDSPDTDTLSLNFATAASVAMLGAETQVASGTVASASGPSYSTNTLNQVTINSFNWAPYVGAIIRKHGASAGTGLYSAVLSDLGSGTALLGVSTLTAAPLSTGFQAGDTIEILAFTKAPSVVTQNVSSVSARFLNLANNTTTYQASVNNGAGSFSASLCTVNFGSTTHASSFAESAISFNGTSVTGSLTAANFSTFGGNNFIGNNPSYFFTGSLTLSDSVFYPSSPSSNNILISAAPNTTVSITTRLSPPIGVGIFNLSAGDIGIGIAAKSYLFPGYIFGANNSRSSYVVSYPKGAYAGAASGAVSNVVEASSAGFKVEWNPAGNAISSTGTVIPNSLAGVSATYVDRLASGRGPSVASASLLAVQGFTAFVRFTVTGTTTVNTISTFPESNGVSNLNDGYTMTLDIQNGCTFTNGSTSHPFTDAGMTLFGNVDAVLAAGSSITLMFNKDSSGFGAWQEVDRLPLPGSMVTGGSAITALTGDGTASGPGSVPFTLHNIPTAVTQAGYVNATGIATPATPATGHGNEYYDSGVQNFGVITEAGAFKHGVQTLAAVAHTYLTGINDAGFPSSALVGESDVTSLSSDLSTINTTLAGKQPTGSYVTGISSGPVGFSGFSSGLVASAINLGGSGFSGALPLVDLALCSPGQIVGMIGGVEGCVTPTAGTVYTGTSPIVVSGSAISCPTCGTSSGSVTGVFGTAGQVTVTPSSPNPAVSLVAKGPGAGSYGGNGIAGFTLDAFGALASVTPATYLTATGTTPGTYNNLTVASSGLIVGNSNTSWMAAGKIMESGGPSAVPVPASSGDIAAALGFPTTNLVLVSTSTSAAPYGDSTFSFNPTSHTLSLNNLVAALNIQVPLAAGAPTAFDTSGYLTQMHIGSGLSYNASTETLSGSAQTMFFAWNLQGTQATSGGVVVEGGMNTTVGGANGNGYPALQSFTHVTMSVNVYTNVCTGGGSPLFQVNILKNGSGILNVPINCGVTGIVSTGAVSVSISAGDLIEFAYDGTLFGTSAGPQVTAFVTARFDP